MAFKQYRLRQCLFVEYLTSKFYLRYNTQIKTCMGVPKVPNY